MKVKVGEAAILLGVSADTVRRKLEGRPKKLGGWNLPYTRLDDDLSSVEGQRTYKAIRLDVRDLAKFVLLRQRRDHYDLSQAEEPSWAAVRKEALWMTTVVLFYRAVRAVVERWTKKGLPRGMQDAVLRATADAMEGKRPSSKGRAAA
ncbi:MAG: hypothetical protein AAGN66_05520 [Acidobacteriota bacterium]